jgi:hypothetical protein
MKRQPYTDPRTRLPPEALCFLSAVRRQFGTDAARDVFVFHNPNSPNCAQGEIGNSTSATKEPSK